MTFLSPLLLALAVFAALPLLLHLIRRKRVRILDLPTFRYLKKAALEQRFHLRLQDQFLMILRMLVLLLLALAFAGPLTSRSTPDNEPTLGVRNLLVLDDSLSMNTHEGDETLYQKGVSLSRELISDTRTDWRVVLASQVAGNADPLSGAATDLETFDEVVRRAPKPVMQGPLQPILSQLDASLDPETVLWAVTDRTAANWSEMRSATGEAVWAEVLLVGRSEDRPNIALTQLDLKNAPLLPGESALLTVGFQTYGKLDRGPESIRIGWQSSGEDGRQERTIPVPQLSPSNGVFETVLETSGEIQSVSASLALPMGVSDSLPEDNHQLEAPSYLDPAQMVLLAEGSGRLWLQAALKDFDLLPVGPADPLPAEASQAGAFILLLSDRNPSDEWKRLLDQSIRSGAGMLVLYDRSPDGLRLGLWADWWKPFGLQSTLDRALEGSLSLKAGQPDWFAGSLDTTSRLTDWAESGFNYYYLEQAESELLAGLSNGAEVPLFQWHPLGEGGIATWNVPIDPRESGLILQPGWVPLLSQMVKRTLISPDTMDRSKTDLGGGGESDLSALDSTGLAQLRSAGIRCSEGLSVIENLGNLPTKQRDWTTILVGLCLLVALIELTISNVV